MFLLMCTLMFAVAACGKKEGKDKDVDNGKQSEGGSVDNIDNGESGAWYNDDASKEDIFKRHGLNDVIPEGCTFIRRWMEDPLEDAYVRTKYTFEVDHDPTKEELTAYAKKIIEQSIAASDNGKAYSMDYDFHTNTSTFNEVTPEDGKTGWCIWWDNRFWDVGVDSGPFDDYYVYSLSMEESIINKEIWPENK